jgi:hypothetical protein
MQVITFYSIKPASVLGVITKPDFAYLLTDKDTQIIAEEWKKIQKESPHAYSKPQSRATLWDTSNKTSKLLTLEYRTTDFATYATATRTSKERKLSPTTYEHMRIASVAAVIKLKDKSVMVHRRPKTLPHCPHMIDASVAGLVDVYNGKIDFEGSLEEKILRELRIPLNMVGKPEITASVSTSAPSLSACITYLINSNLTRSEVSSCANKQFLRDITFIEDGKIPDFIVEHFGEKDEMCGDGAAALLACLPNDTFEQVMLKCNYPTQRIRFGTLREGIFS